jgi:hypothetical protein
MKYLLCLMLIAGCTLPFLGCSEPKSTVIEAAPGTKPPTEEQLAEENARRTAEMSGAAADMKRPDNK